MQCFLSAFSSQPGTSFSMETPLKASLHRNPYILSILWSIFCHLY